MYDNMIYIINQHNLYKYLVASEDPISIIAGHVRNPVGSSEQQGD